MFSLFKSKPKLAELIPEEYIDIHSHILPGLDDGAKTIEETKFLLAEMKKLGFTKIITTPHTKTNVWDNTSADITNTLNEVKKRLNQSFEIQAASEYTLNESLIQKANENKVLTLKNNWVLMELPYSNPPIPLYDFIYQLQLAGYQIIVAHPERYTYFHSNKKEYTNLKKAGCFFQLNLLATVGYYGKDVAEAANYLLKTNMYDFAGSDIHHYHHVAAFQNKILYHNGDKIKEVMKKNSFFK